MRITVLTIAILLMIPFAAAQSHLVDTIDPPLEGEFPGSRGPGQMIIYTADYGNPTTGTNEWGVEAIVEEGLVVSVGPNDSAIPENGFVVSGHEGAGRWVSVNLRVGTPVVFDAEEIRIDDTPAGILRALPVQLAAAEASLIEQGASRGSLFAAMQTRNEIEEFAALGEPIDVERLAELEGRVEALMLEAIDLELAAIPSPTGEIRGVWHRLTEWTPEEIEGLAQDLADAHMNMLLPETIYDSAAIYVDPTGLYPLRDELNGFDALAFLIDECHERGIEVHVWVECFYIGAPGEDGSLPYLAEAHPDWLACDREGRQQAVNEPRFMWFNSSHPEVRQALIDAYVALVQTHPIDGFQFDYIRVSGAEWDYSDFTRERVRDELGFDPVEITEEENPDQWAEWMAWREDQITSFVREASEAMRAVRPDIRFSAAVVSDLELARRVKAQNWAEWVQEGSVDFLMSMAYALEADSVAEATAHMGELQPEGMPLIIGLGAYMGLTPLQIVEQIVAVRGAGATGQVIFAWHSVPEAMRHALSHGPWRSGGPIDWSEQ